MKLVVTQKLRAMDSGHIYEGHSLFAQALDYNYREDAELIAAAVNACRSLNPADPLAAANALPDVVAALEAILANDEARMPARLGRQVERSLAALKGGAQ